MTRADATQLPGPFLSPPYVYLSHEMHTSQIDILSQTFENYSFSGLAKNSFVFFHKMLGKKLEQIFWPTQYEGFTCGWIPLQNQIHEDSN